MIYRIREVDGGDEEIADTLSELHKHTFFDSAPLPAFDVGHWWIGYHGDEPVSFSNLLEIDPPNSGYLARVGVLPAHRGHGLQLRHIRVREARARRNGWVRIATDTTDNPSSANNLIAAGYRLFTPAVPWGFAHSLYWWKRLVQEC